MGTIQEVEAADELDAAIRATEGRDSRRRGCGPPRVWHSAMDVKVQCAILSQNGYGWYRQT